MSGVLHATGAIALFLLELLKTARRSREGTTRLVLEQIWMITSRSLGTVVFAGVFVGAILVIQFHLMLSKYGATTLLGGLNTSALIREVGPLIISFLLAGKIGAFTAAEIGTMKVTEQIDAIRCLGSDPLRILILPRFLGIVLSSVILLIFGLSVSVAGAALISELLYGINYLQFLQGIPRFSSAWTLGSGLLKSTVYGIIVASVACYQGYAATGGARGVGRAVTAAALYTNFFIVICNFVCSQLLDLALVLIEGFHGPGGWL